MYCITRSFVVGVTELLTKTLGNCTEIAWKTTKTSNFSAISRSILSIFDSEIDLICCRKLTETTFCSLIRGFNILVHKVCRYCGINWTKMMKKEKFWDFLIFDVNSRHFSFKNCIYRSTKHTGQHLFLVDPFQHSNLRSMLKISKKKLQKL